LGAFAAVYAKTAESIAMPFMGLTQWAKEHLLDGIEIPHGKGQFLWIVRPIQTHGQSPRPSSDHSVRRTSSRLAGVTLNFLRREKSADGAFCQKNSSTTSFIK